MIRVLGITVSITLALANSIIGSVNTNAISGNNVNMNTTATSIADMCAWRSAKQRGGTLYIKESSSATSWTHAIDLGQLLDDAACEPGSKPHMVLPSPDHRMVAITETASPSLFILDAQTKKVLQCLRVSTVGSKIHTAYWMYVGGDLMLIAVDMTGAIGGASGGGGLHMWMITSDGRDATKVTEMSMPNAFGLPPTATKPIAAGAARTNATRLVVTDAKSAGLYVVAVTKTNLIAVTRHHGAVMGNCANGGGLWVAPVPGVVNRVIAVYGKQVNNASCLIEVDTVSGAVVRNINLPYASVDAHGIGYCRANDGLFIMSSNRVSASLDILKYESGVVVSTTDLNSFVSPAAYTGACLALNSRLASRRLDAGIHSSAAFMPDVMSVRYHKIWQPGRGRAPVSAVAASNSFEHAAPGAYSYTLLDTCRGVRLSHDDVAIAASDDLTTGASADPHGGDFVGDAYWMIDQAPSGAIMLCNGLSTYLSKAAMVELHIPAYALQTCNVGSGGTGDM